MMSKMKTKNKEQIKKQTKAEDVISKQSLQYTQELLGSLNVVDKTVINIT